MKIENEIESLMQSIVELSEINIIDFINFIEISINSSSEIPIE